MSHQPSSNNTQQTSASSLLGANNTYCMEEVALDRIHEHPENDYSMREDELSELMESIERDGLGQLPLVRKLSDGSLQMIAGHRRLECFRRLKERADQAGVRPNPYERIPVNIVSDLDDARASILLNVTNLIARNLSQEERGRRYAAIGMRVPAMRAQDPELRGVRTNEIIARIVSRETGSSVSEATVKRAIAAEKRLQDARNNAERLRSDLTANWQVEASTGKIDPVTLKAISELPDGRQEELFVEFQRNELSSAGLRSKVRSLEPRTGQDAQRELDRALVAVERLVAMRERGVGISESGLQRLHGLLDRLIAHEPSSLSLE